ncbi:MAG: ABC transporter permease subunit [Candidatus Bipolaricaulota bacterium]
MTLATPSFVILGIGFLAPLVLLFLLSWRQSVPGSGLILDQWTTANYTRLLFDAYYFKIFWRTFTIALYATLLSLALGYPIAMAIARSKGRAKVFLLAVVLTPLLTNVVARTLGLMILLGRHGPINNLLVQLGLPRLTLVPGVPGIVIGLTQVFMPFLILSVSSVLENIDPALVEAARSLGCTRFGAFRRVVLPLSVPGIVGGSLFVFLLSFSAFVTPQLLGGGMVVVMTTLIRQQAMVLLNWPFASAVAIVLLLVSIVLVGTYTRALGGAERRESTRVAASGKISSWGRAVQGLRSASYDLAASLGRAWARFARYLRPMGQALGRLRFMVRAGGWGGKALIIAFILAPLPIVIVSSFSGSSLIMFPPRGGFSVRWYVGLLSRPEYIRSFFISLQIAALSVLIGVSTGTLAALALVRYRFPGREVLRTLFLSPLMLPAVLVGLALLRLLAMMGWTATFRGVLIGHLVLVTAYVIRTVSASLVGFDHSLEEASRNLGAGVFRTFRRVTFPLIKPGLIVASIFAFLVSFDETTVSVFITGPGTITLPVRLFSQLEYGLDPTVTAISSILVVIALLALLVADRLLGLEKFSTMR